MGGRAIAASIGAISHARVHVGTPELRSLIDDIAGRATSHLHTDVFRVGDEAVVEALASLRGRDVHLSVLSDTDATVGKMAKRLHRAASTSHELGADPIKQHGKSLSRDGGAEAFIATDLADADAVRRMETAVSFEGAPAAALAKLHAATEGSSLRTALADAAHEGVVVNDPRVATQHATQAVEMLAKSTGAFRLATKAFDSKNLARLLATRAASDPVEVVTHVMPKSQQQLLRKAGVTVHIVNERAAEKASRAIHGTLLQSGDRALLGSMYLEDRVLYGSAGRNSREVAAVLSGDAAGQARAAIDQIVNPFIARA